METMMEEIFTSPQIWIIVAWSLAWKSWALWRAVKNDQKGWYGVLLITNTAGLLEILYLLFFQKKDKLWEKIVKRKE